MSSTVKVNGDHWSVLSPSMESELQKIASNLLSQLQSIMSSRFENDCSTLVNKYLWSEALESARQSIHFHKDTNTPSLYKELGHICFWFSKLKPIELIEKKKIRTKEVALVPINEMFSILFCLKLICYMEKTFIAYALKVKNGEISENDAKDMGLKESDWTSLSESIAQERISKVNDSVNKTGLKITSLSHSLRFHNYSARAMATSFEWVFAGADSFSWQ